MKIFYLLLLVFSYGFAGDEQKEKTEVKDPKGQEGTRAASVEDLKKADERINMEREAVAKTERRIATLIEDLENRSQALAAKETSIQEMLKKNADTDQDQQIGVPQAQVDYWDKRVMSVAAKDFKLLYLNEPAVAVNIIIRMKKKNSARLIDEVSKLQPNGIEVAAKLNEAVGTGRIEKI